MSYQSEVLADSPALYWRLGESSGLPVDSSGNGLDASTVNGSPTYSQASPIAGTAIDFATTAWFTRADHTLLDPHTGSFTVELWMKTTQATNGQICRKISGAGYFLDCQNVAGNVRARFIGPGGTPAITVAATSTTVADGGWHHIVGVLDRSVDMVYVYFDGQLAASGGAATLAGLDIDSTAALELPGRGTTLAATLDEFAIYQTALSATRIGVHFTVGSTPALPTVRVDVAFGNNPGDTSYTWTAISGDGRAVRWKRGREHIFRRVETGTLELTVNDATGKYDGRLTSSPYYPDVVPITPVRLRLESGVTGTVYPIFQGYVDSWERSLRVANVYAERTVPAVDALELFAHAGLAGETYSAQLTGARVSAVLDSIGWPTGASYRQISAGQSTMQATTFGADDETKALEHLGQVQTDENGLLFIDGAGKVIFLDRVAINNSPYTTSQMTFSDTPGTGEYPYVGLVLSNDKDIMTNEWRGTRTGGSTQVASDSASITRYWLRSQTYSSQLNTDNEVLAALQYRLSTTKNPSFWVTQVILRPGNDTAFWEALLELELGDRITIEEQPPGFAAAVVNDYHIQGIEGDIPPGPLTQATITFSLWPVDDTQWFVLNDATTGKFNTGKLSY